MLKSKISINKNHTDTGKVNKERNNVKDQKLNNEYTDKDKWLIILLIRYDLEATPNLKVT